MERESASTSSPIPSLSLSFSTLTKRHDLARSIISIRRVDRVNI